MIFNVAEDLRGLSLARKEFFMKPVLLKNVTEHLSMQTDDGACYLDTRTGEITFVDSESMTAADRDQDLENFPEWQQDVILEAKEILSSDDYLLLPSRFDIHDYAIIEKFCFTYPDEEISDELMRKIKGSGAFRRFKTVIRELGIEDEYYSFYQSKLEEIDIEWLDQNSIPYAR
jgi:hypothetical protein